MRLFCCGPRSSILGCKDNDTNGRTEHFPHQFKHLTLQPCADGQLRWPMASDFYGENSGKGRAYTYTSAGGFPTRP